MRKRVRGNRTTNSAQLVTGAPRFPEFITFDKEGQLYTGDSDGEIYKVPFGAEGNLCKRGCLVCGRRFCTWRNRITIS
ncbi:hypothetical protein [Paenibacillus pabuli]|uniref:hypothetical protein n=1 Tax=Paenibacillus pabuli TaxID=1472 RepID=UPI001FDEEB83|nr:hypothetical protein [Paenibacillus pabuli]